MYIHVYTNIYMHKHIHVTCFGKIDKFASEFEVDMRAYTRKLSNKVLSSLLLRILLG